MGAADPARIDVVALTAIAARYDDAAGLVDTAVRTHLSALSFDGASAGRAYGGHGDALRRALDDLGYALSDWSRAASGIAAGLRASADRYTEADARAADRVR
ncbi:ESX-1 secretion-associated protein [Mycobacterium sp. PS03-16]|uniref:type VII secretion target n=1 Tax=Mycobacterium sp. PS03-16 TaxID=2559611 RepID=UPI0010747D7B|nr:type VII secretion target [Mycobacterium sp. PS03-16]TFV54837.1 ESX-1 secretion-associated protein [Mycobacterium sp. PS03-16]